MKLANNTRAAGLDRLSTTAEIKLANLLPVSFTIASENGGSLDAETLCGDCERTVSEDEMWLTIAREAVDLANLE